MGEGRREPGRRDTLPLAFFTAIPVNNVMSHTEPDTSNSRDDSSVSSAAHHHHAELWSQLAAREAALVNAVAAGHDHEEQRRALVEFLRGDVFAHLQTEEMVLYNAARGVGAHALVAALELDHKSLLSLVEHIDQAATGLDAALSARALVMLFVLRMEKEETVLIPALAEAGVDVSTLIAGRPEMLGEIDVD
ncbi:hypothetical protein GB881_02830 [Georgenia subflava]|uniref:Hemerythrin-like domain-containing protein n=2 Tax=Georgenia subflava TaxID=1622177 RepID=A0A6N7EC49_9MICO|nr:hypothetical protein [Georgenia subflava]